MSSRAAPLVLLGLACAAACTSHSGRSPIGSSSVAPTTSATPAPTTSRVAPPPPAPSPPSFVTVDRANARFTLGGKPFYFAATNAYYLGQQRAYGSPVTLETLDAVQALGLKVVRTIAYFDGWAVAGTNASDPAIIQKSPGVYNPSGLEALDFVIAEAAKRDLRLVLVLGNNWDDFGGANQYVAWAGLAGHDTFFTSAAVKQLYKDYVRDIVSRVNAITGVAYRDDPTILGWELLNEARCASDPGAKRGVLVDWYGEMARHVKSLDPNHLVGTGEEGNDVSTSGYSTFTGTSWLDGSLGSSYRANVAIPEVDWATVHVYPDLAGMKDPLRDGSDWIADHARIARAAGKPLMVGEFGLSTSPHAIYAAWLDVVLSTDVAGAAVWELVTASRSARVKGATDIVCPTDATDVYALVRHAAAMNAK